MARPVKIKNKDGSVVYKVEVCFKGRRSSKRFPTMREAKQWELDQTDEFESEEAFLARDKTVREAFEKYATEESPKKKSRRWEITRLTKLSRDPIANILLSEIRDTDLEVFIERSRASGLCDDSILRELTQIQAVFSRTRKKWKWTTNDPFVGLDKPKASKHRRRRLESWESKALCTALGVDESLSRIETKSQQVGALFLLAIETGMRVGELVKLRWSDIDLSKKYLTVRDSKNGDSREVPLSTRAREILVAIRDGYKQPCTNESRLVHMSSDSAGALFRKARNKTTVCDFRFHDTRHEAASRLAKRYSLLELCKVFGWRDTKFAMVYFNPTAEELAARLD